MKKIFSFLNFTIIFALALFSACSQDEPENIEKEDNDLTEEQLAEIIAKNGEIEEILDQFDGDIDRIINLLKENKFVTDVEYSIEDMLVTIYTQDNYKIYFDISPIPEYEELDQEEIDRIVESLATVFGIYNQEIEDQGQQEGNNHINLVSQISRSENNGVYLEANRINLMFYDYDIRKRDMPTWENIIRELNKKVSGIQFRLSLNSDDLSSYTPAYYRDIFPKYNINYICGHGSPGGKIFFNFKGVSKDCVNQYIKLGTKEKSGVVFTYKYNAKGEIEKTEEGKFLLEGVSLEYDFFNNHLGTFENSIVWSAICHSGAKDSDFKKACLEKGALSFFGPTKVMTYPQAQKLFTQWVGFLGNGVSVTASFNNVKPVGMESIPIGDGEFIMERPSDARAPYPEATRGASKSTENSKKPATRDEDNSDVIKVGVRFRFAIDEYGNACYSSIGGVKLENLDDGSLEYIPMTVQNTDLYSSNKVLYNFVINEYDVRIPNLKGGCRYRYSAYLSDGVTTAESPQSFEFTAPESDSDVYIYSKKDLIEFVNNVENNIDGYATKNAKLMADISLNDYTGNKNSLKIPYQGYFDGNGHKIYLSPSNESSYYLFNSLSGEISDMKIIFSGVPKGNSTFIHQINDSGRMDNITFNIDGDISVSGNDISFVSANMGTIDKCNVNINLSNGPISFAGFVSSNYGVVSNTIVNAKGNITKFYGIAYTNFGVIEKCKVEGNVSYSNTLSNGVPMTFSACVYANHKGTIKDTETNINNSYNVDCDYTPNAIYSVAVSGFVMDNAGEIINCKSRGNINENVTGLKYHLVNQPQTADGICAFVMYNSGIIKNCHTYGSIQFSLWGASAFGGSNSNIISECSSNVSIKYIDSSGNQKKEANCEKENHIGVQIAKRIMTDTGGSCNINFNGNIIVPQEVCAKIID